jgi:hypothetical protein
MDQVRLIQDKSNSEYVFSDGSGFISPALMKKVANIFKFEKVSAIQMRFGGFKGVLVENPILNENTPQILFRESMKKFDGKLNELSVIRCSTYSPAFLNRQVILLLHNLGVPDQLFLDRNFAAVQNLDVNKTLLRLQKQTAKINLDNKKGKFSQDEAIVIDNELIKEVKLYFGPSRQFKRIFV